MVTIPVLHIETFVTFIQMDLDLWDCLGRVKLLL